MSSGLLLAVVNVGLLAAACSSTRTPPRPSTPAPTAERAPVPPHVIALDRPDLYSSPAALATEELCAKAEPGADGEAYGFDFDPTPIRPLPSGPLIRERARPGVPRKWNVVDSPDSSLRDCYRWARVRSPEYEGTVSARLHVDELGRTERVEPASSQPELAELAACVADVISTVRLHGVTPRRTQVSLSVRFGRSGLGTPPHTLKRPATPPPAPLGAACLRAPATRPIDRLDVRLSVSDFDHQQQAAEDEFAHRRALVKWRRGGSRGPPPQRASRPRMEGGTFVSARLTGADVQQALMANHGAYQRCYAAAVARHAGLAGHVAFRLEFDRAGSVAVARRVREDGSGATGHFQVTEPDLEACLLQALREVWIDVSEGGPFSVRYPMELLPAVTSEPAPPVSASAAAVERYAAALLEAGWFERALHAYGALVEQADDGPRRCGWHVGALRAALAVEPWGGERVLGAARDLIAYLVTHREAAEGTCLDVSAELLEHFILEPFERLGLGNGVRHGHAWYLKDLSAPRYGTVVGQAPFLSTRLHVPDEIRNPPPGSKE